MAKATGIAWTDHSWNPWIGCTMVSPGCDNCYARAIDKRYKLGGATHWGPGVPRYLTKSWGVPVAWNRKAAAAGKRATVFPSMCDPFDNEVPQEWRTDLFRLIARTPALTWLLLTKRIGNVPKMLHLVDAPPLPNVWIGVSVVNQKEADRDIPDLLATPAALHFLSLEPMLGPICLDEFHPFRAHRYCNDVLKMVKGVLAGHIGWVICGGESSQGGAKARPFDIAWARDTVKQCKEADVPCFVKQLGSAAYEKQVVHGIRDARPLALKDRAGADPAEWPADLRVQEFP